MLALDARELAPNALLTRTTSRVSLIPRLLGSYIYTDGFPIFAAAMWKINYLKVYQQQ